MSDLVSLFGSMGLDFSAIGPEVILTVAACLVLIIDLFYKRKSGGHLLTVGALGLIAAGVFAWRSGGGAPSTAFHDMVAVDAFSRFMKIALCGATLVTFLLSTGYAKRHEVESAEYYALMLFGTVGMMLMASGADLVLIFIGIEISSISQYILAGFRQEARQPRSGCNSSRRTSRARR